MLQAPDGELLSSIDRKKAMWYVNKGLATEISSESAFIVRLNFEPAGRCVGAADEFYRIAKTNQCVVCGQTEKLFRKNVIPREYKKFFPDIMKSKTSHDVVLLCVECNIRSNLYDLKIRQLLEEECEAPIKSNLKDDKGCNKLIAEKRLAKALLSEQKIPDKRRNEIKEILQKSYANQEINEEFCQKLMMMEISKPERIALSHGELVVKRYKEIGGLAKLEKLWRQHFLDVMQPKFLPALWNVDHNKDRLEKRAKEGRVDMSDLKVAGVDAVIVPRISIETIKSNEVKQSIISTKESSDEEKFAGSSSDLESFHSARASDTNLDLDSTLTEDDHFFSDAMSAQSFYETVRSDNSTLDDFQSFSSSLTELQHFDSDDSRSSMGSQDFSIDSDTEVEDDHDKIMLLH